MVSVTIIDQVEYGERSRLKSRVLAQVAMSVGETIVPSDLRLTSIEAASIQEQNDAGVGTVSATQGSWLAAKVVRPGSYANGGNLLRVKATGWRVVAGSLDGTVALVGSFTVAVQADGW